MALGQCGYDLTILNKGNFMSAFMQLPASSNAFALCTVAIKDSSFTSFSD